MIFRFLSRVKNLRAAIIAMLESETLSLIAAISLVPTMALGAAYVFFGPPRKPVAKKALPESAKIFAAKLLPPALEAAAKKHGVEVRATLFSRDLEELYAHNMANVPSVMAAIAKAKAYSCMTLPAEALRDPGLLELMGIMLKWTLGLSKHVDVQGSVPVQLPGVPLACFVVNGAPKASQDRCIAEEVLAACGLKKDLSGKWVLRP